MTPELTREDVLNSPHNHDDLKSSHDDEKSYSGQNGIYNARSDNDQ
jgi:hypothetical protein